MPEASIDGMLLRFDKDGWLEWIVNRPVPEITLLKVLTLYPFFT